VERDFVPVGRFASAFYIFLAHPKVGVRTLKELIDKAKAEPGKLNYASGGIGGCDVHRHRGAESTSSNRPGSCAVQRRRPRARLDPWGRQGHIRSALPHRQTIL